MMAANARQRLEQCLQTLNLYFEFEKEKVGNQVKAQFEVYANPSS